MRQAAGDVVLHEQQRHLVRGGGQRLDLLQDVQAVGFLADQPLEAAGLALDPLEAVEQQAAILGVCVAKVFRPGATTHEIVDWVHANVGDGSAAG